MNYGGATVRNLTVSHRPLWRKSGRIVCCLLVLTWSIPATGDEQPSSKPAADLTEQEALNVLNDSAWAHTVTPTTQDTPCTYQNSAFPGLYPEERAAGDDAESPVASSGAVQPDRSEYLIRWQSVKPVQAAIARLVALDGRWSAYGKEREFVSKQDGPTDVANALYNIGDMITIAIILKHSGPDGETFFDYGFKKHSPPFSWPCAGLRTGNGQVFARVADPGLHGQFHAFQLSFPSLVDGKPLISHTNEKVEFRFVAKQRVFETTFYINADDVLDGSETLLYLPSAFTDLKEIAQQ